MILDYKDTQYCKSDGSHAWWHAWYMLLTFSIFSGPVYNFTTELQAKRGWGM